MQQQEDPSTSGIKEHEETETDDGTDFENSLRELRGLCSHLHQAANYCEKSFLKARHKRNVVANTKEYICKAMVTVVDHLGTVSAKLECRFLETNSVSEAELRINSLNQRLGTCQSYSQLLALKSNSWDAYFPRHHPRYILPPIQDPQRTENIIRRPITVKTALLETEEEVPLFLFSTFDDNLQGRKSLSKPALPVRDGMSILPPMKDQKFQFLESPKLKRGIRSWKLARNRETKWLIRRGQ